MIVASFLRGEKLEKRKEKSFILKESEVKHGNMWEFVYSSREAKQFLSKASVCHTLDNLQQLQGDEIQTQITVVVVSTANS